MSQAQQTESPAHLNTLEEHFKPSLKYTIAKNR